MTRKIAGVTDAAVANATGEDWDHWLALLDEAGATELTHKEIVATLREAGVERGWWQQKLAVGYGYERGLRTVGETSDAGFQVGVQRTLSIPRDDLWTLLVGPRGREHWLGHLAELPLEPGTTYETADGTTGDLRSVNPPERLRLTWQPADRDAATTLQLYLVPSGGDDDRTALRIHHEKLESETDREAMREHWRAVLDALESLVDGEASTS